MNRKGFLLGLYSVGGQVLLLRELESSLNGDELFIGTALFGWLLAVAAGAYLGGKPRFVTGSGRLFAIGVVILPMTLVAARLWPLAVTGVVGEIIPFTTAALISIVTMLPVGLISGWLFPSITADGDDPTRAVVRVYLFEGAGAFAGGLAVTFLAGGALSTLETAVALAIVVSAGSMLNMGAATLVRIASCSAATIVVLLLMPSALGPLDRYIESAKYRAYHLVESFDTHYGHQAVLSLGRTLTLLTDNTIEGVYPDLMAAENTLLPPLVYFPGASHVLLAGRSELGVAQLADSLPGLSLTAVDQRARLTGVLNSVLPVPSVVRRVSDDPVTFFSRPSAGDGYDIVILNAAEPASYKSSRLLTGEFMTAVRARLSEGGVVFIPTRYDTDRYITAEEKRLLGVINNVLRGSFRHVAMWPGNMTLFFASDSDRFNLSLDSIIRRLDGLAYRGQYVGGDYLGDRLEEIKRQRLAAAVEGSSESNSINRPLLPHYQVSYNAKANRFDRWLVAAAVDRPRRLMAVPAAILAFFLLSLRADRRRGSYGLFLYFVAGLASLSLELVSFYVYQSSAGSLYAEMAVLIGAFMLGLAGGACCATRKLLRRPGRTALLVLLAATLVLLLTHASVPPRGQLLYQLVFLVIVAAATGLLFAAATSRYYSTRDGNRGSGYACELIGSSVGALLTTTILLPVIGLNWLLGSLALLIALALAGSALTARRSW
jgi:spermidine synthase